MPVSTSNLLQGPATVYWGAFGAAEPLDSALNLAPGAAWTDFGGTSDGLEMGVYENYEMLQVDQIIEDADARRTAREVRAGTKLAEPTLANLAVSLNEAPPTAGTSPVGPVFEPTSGGNFLPVFRSILFDGYAPAGFRRRVILRKCLQTTDLKLNHAKGDQTMIPVEFKSFFVSSTIRPFRIIDGIAST